MPPSGSEQNFTVIHTNPGYINGVSEALEDKQCFSSCSARALCGVNRPLVPTPWCVIPWTGETVSTPLGKDGLPYACSVTSSSQTQFFFSFSIQFLFFSVFSSVFPLFSFPAFQLLCFSFFLLFIFSAFHFLCYSVYLFFIFSTFQFLCFSISLLISFSAFQFLYFSVSLLFSFSAFQFLHFQFSAFQLSSFRFLRLSFPPIVSFFAFQFLRFSMDNG